VRVSDTQRRVPDRRKVLRPVKGLVGRAMRLRARYGLPVRGREPRWEVDVEVDVRQVPRSARTARFAEVTEAKLRYNHA
jgi:hypothetical protein